MILNKEFEKAKVLETQADIYVKQGDKLFKEILKTYTKALSYDPTNKDILIKTARCYEKEKNFNAAAELY